MWHILSQAATLRNSLPSTFPAFHICTQAQVLNLFKDLQRRYGFSLMLVTRKVRNLVSFEVKHA